MVLNPIKQNMNEVDLGEKGKILFSYKTAVAAMIDEGLGYIFYKTNKKWSNTTTRHINQWLGIYGKVANEKPQEYFDHLITHIEVV